ncbi:ABC1 kinase family protein [Microbacter margulisiae]|uniref:Ubiquinone biosynthesis protein n=1 Tax=Microbacter margulisiae TaxID=1350067 RepID=A0A7W5DNF0_9PORP|nr:AarF/UbiB family protein [Microbacter margulisiae]MBB3186147.1 ubiquinone biosynthesis protein [Microbacter margulisiae]
MQIVKILLKHAMREWFYRSRLGRSYLRHQMRRHPKAQLQVHTTPERVRITIEELGPTYIKFGQILADRPDMISERFRLELKKLQSTAYPFDDSTAIKLIQDELGAVLEAVFAEFDTHCLAAASIGQVYQARLVTGEEVVVKIQRPHIEKKIRLDLYLMHYIAKQFVKNYPELAAINVVGFIDEFEDKIHRELDYTQEAANIRRFEFMFQNDSTVHIPKVFTQYTTHRLLVMEKITGITPDHLDKLKEGGYDMHQIAVNGANILLKMILEEGFFHADPHPGNLFILPGNVIGMIDFGMVGVLRPREMNFLAQFSVGLVRQDARAIASALLTLCDVKFYDRTEDLEFSLDQLLKQYRHLSIEEIDFSKMVQDCLNVVISFKLKIPSGIFMLAKAVASLEKFAGQLDPTISITPLILPYAKNLVMQRYTPRKIASSIYDTLMDYVTLINTLPGSVNEILYKLKEGTVHHQVHIDDQNPVTRVLRLIGSRVTAALLIIGVFVGSSIMIINTPERPYGLFALYFSSVLILLLLIKVLFGRKK